MTGAAVAGMDALVVRYYSTDNAVERGVLKDIMTRGIELDGERREDQAERIVSALGRALDSKKKGSRAR